MENAHLLKEAEKVVESLQNENKRLKDKIAKLEFEIEGWQLEHKILTDRMRR